MLVYLLTSSFVIICKVPHNLIAILIIIHSPPIGIALIPIYQNSKANRTTAIAAIKNIANINFFINYYLFIISSINISTPSFALALICLRL